MATEVGAVLLVARERIRRDGWYPVEGHHSKWTLFGSVWDQPPTLGRWNARMLLERVARLGPGGLERWDTEPMRSKAQALRLLNLGLATLGLYFGRRRGPACSMGPGRPIRFPVSPARSSR